MSARIEDVEAAIVGGGPAGLSAALVLGRCRRRVVLFDDGRYRNARAHAVHGFLSRDGIEPALLRRLGRSEIARYDSVQIRERRVVDARRDGARFVLETDDGYAVRARAVLLATGIVDRLPEVPGADELYGDGLLHCPYCDGWELRDQPLIAYAHEAGYARELSRWTRDLVLCTDGRTLAADDGARLARRGVTLDGRAIARFERDGRDVRVVFAEGPPRRARAVFFHLGAEPRNDLARRLGCEIDDKGGVVVTRLEASCVPRLYVAGDTTRDVLQAVVAAGEGAAAAVMIDQALDDEA